MPLICIRCRYNKMVGEIRSITTKLQKLDSRDPFRIKSTQQLLEKLCAQLYLRRSSLFAFCSFNMGLIQTKKGLSLTEAITASSFCR
jgi:U3 small nucleolar ribonucleoprotein protein IMP3